MTTELTVAGVICLAMAVGHTVIGVRWVLPHITADVLPRTPVGTSSMSVSMVRVTWFVVTIFATGAGAILLTLAWSDVDAHRVVLRWLAAMWLGATIMAAWVSRVRLRNVRSFLRLPVPLLWVVVGVLCWVAS